jgi:hypothetical protein
MSVIPLLLAARRRDRLISVIPEPSDIHLSIGSFLPHSGGVTIQFAPPLSMLSNSYPWWIIPQGLAVVRVLAEGEPCLARSPQEDSVFELLLKWARLVGGMSKDEVDDLVCDMVDDLEALVRLSARFAGLCPDSGIAGQIRLVAAMNPAELGEYVLSFVPDVPG